MRRLIFTLTLLMGAAAQAGPVVVLTDSGNIGSFNLENQGVDAGGTATMVFGVPGVSSSMNTVNGIFVAPEQVTVNTPVVLFVTPTGVNSYSLALDPPTYTKTIGDTPGAQAILEFNLQVGATNSALPDFFNAAGLVTSVLANQNLNFDFSRFDAGGRINLTFTATTFTGADSFAGLFATPGATAVGNGSFSQAAVAEPVSFSLLGMGIIGFCIFRRWMIREGMRA